MAVDSVLVIVLNYNKREMVLQCLDSLCHQHYEPCHVVVVDNASSDGSVEAIRAVWPEIDLLCNESNLGAIAGRNAGVSYARQKYTFDYILFLDDDAEVTPDAVGKLVAALKADPDTGIVCGKTYLSFDGDILMSAGIRERFYFALCYDRGAGEPDCGQYDEECYVEACGAFAFMIRAELFAELEGFDPVFSPYGWEEVDLCLRARRLGARTRYVPRAKFCHKGTRLGRKPIPGYERNKVTNYLALIQRHMTPTQKLSAIVFVPLRALLLIGRFIWQGNWGVIPAQFRGLGDFLRRGDD
jgi:GT2 family glycosyltransferase